MGEGTYAGMTSHVLGLRVVNGGSAIEAVAPAVEAQMRMPFETSPIGAVPPENVTIESASHTHTTQTEDDECDPSTVAISFDAGSLNFEMFTSNYVVSACEGFLDIVASSSKETF